jgi:hypothetical protein
MIKVQKVDNKMKNASWKNPDLQAALIAEVRNLGGPPKTGKWEDTTNAFNLKTGVLYTKNILQSKFRSLKRKYDCFKDLKQMKEFTWDSDTRTFSAPDEVWETHVNKMPRLRMYHGRSVPQIVDELETIFDGANKAPAPAPVQENKPDLTEMFATARSDFLAQQAKPAYWQVTPVPARLRRALEVFTEKYSCILTARERLRVLSKMKSDARFSEGFLALSLDEERITFVMDILELA